MWVPAASMEGLGSSIGGPNLQIDWKLQLGVPNRFRGLGRQSATLTPLSRSTVPKEDVSDLGAGVGVADWRLRPLILFQFSL
ncbi:hypothetical protein CRG98_025955 [Punica granatum]|uniref:Uncharacterized protein n=1 Tax=Punica granatum TaxID=22663 RepID=A0A2I0JBV9_PUNGR|nr:hypothetical protein CRG98_025955 [Punica granatum]